MAIPEVLPVAEARQSLSKVLETFRRLGRDARPVFFGSRRQAEAVILPIGLFEEILPLIEDALIAREVEARLEVHDGRWVDFDTVDWASKRAVQLILELAGGKALKGVIDVSVPRPARPVLLPPWARPGR